MLVINEWQEGRIKTLLARINKLSVIQSSIVLSPEWDEPGINSRWLRAQRARVKVERKLGFLASLYLKEVA